MAHPILQSSANYHSTAAAGTHTINYPSGVAVGDRLILLITAKDQANIVFGGMANGFDPVLAATGAGNVGAFAYAKVADAGDVGQASFVYDDTGANVNLAARVMRWTGVASIEGTGSASGTNSSPDPPNHSASESAEIAFIAVCGWYGDVALSSYPTNYGNQATDRWAHADGVGIASATRNLVASAENPGAFGLASTTNWGAITIALLPSDESLDPNDVTCGAPTCGTPTITQNHVLDPNDVTCGAPTCGTPTITQNHVLDPNDVTCGAPTCGTPTITQNHVLTPNSVSTAAPTCGTPTLSGDGSLLPDSVASGSPACGNPAITTLIADGELSPTAVATGVPTLGTPTLGQDYSLAPTGVSARSPRVLFPVPYVPGLFHLADGRILSRQDGTIAGDSRCCRCSCCEGLFHLSVTGFVGAGQRVYDNTFPGFYNKNIVTVRWFNVAKLTEVYDFRPTVECELPDGVHYLATIEITCDQVSFPGLVPMDSGRAVGVVTVEIASGEPLLKFSWSNFGTHTFDHFMTNSTMHNTLPQGNSGLTWSPFEPCGGPLVQSATKQNVGGDANSSTVPYFVVDFRSWSDL